MKRGFTIAIVISIALHIGLFSVMIYYNRSADAPFGNGIVTVEVIGDGDGEPANSATGEIEPAGASDQTPTVAEERSLRSAKGGEAISSTPHINSHKIGTPRNDISDGGGPGTAPTGTVGTGGGLGAGSVKGNPVLSKIRRKIEQAKYYPQEAKREKIEGRPEVTFRINPDGTLAGANLKRSSGNNMLDKAALETLKRAAPLPYYEHPISLAIKFSLDD